MSIYTYKHYNQTFKLVLKKSTYANNKRFAAYLADLNDDMVAMITVNLDAPLSKNASNINFVDTNNSPDIENFLIANKIAKPTHNLGFSGFWTYPEYEFDLTKFEEEKQYD